MAKCVVLVGLPAYGKSTYVSNLVSEEEFFVYSTDSYIEDLSEETGKTYTELFPDYIEEAKLHMDALLDLATEECVDVFWDQTNLSSWKRRMIIERMKNAGYSVECVCFEPAMTEEGYKEWKKRLDSRKGKMIPESILDDMVCNFIKPSTKEGFDSVVTVKNTFDPETTIVTGV